MEHYVTLFDRVFLPQGLALHRSLKRHAGPFTLWVLCMDGEVRATLDALADPTLRTIALPEAETPELLAVKGGRTPVEYCWTMTPFTPKLVFDRDPAVTRVTYIDADVFLLRSPQPIFDEFARSGKAVLITDHAYDAEYDQSVVSGQYCVQFMTFVRDACEPVRSWWQDRCIEWCFHRVEDGKLGDQKYLDDWPVRFAGHVHVLTQLDALLAPWNARRFPFSRAIAWHFHGLRLLKQDKVLLHGSYEIPEVARRAVYDQYLRELRVSLDVLGRRTMVQNASYRPFVVRMKLLALNLLRLLRDLRSPRAIGHLGK